jgi:iron only hydrogenase large subunit-like protein
MNDADKLINMIGTKTKLVAMLAPSFPIMYDYPAIIGKLRSIGFSYVVEVTAGAKMTNEQVGNLLKTHPNTRYITSPCASFVQMVMTRYPDLVGYLMLQTDSPMINTAKLVRERYPGHTPVFIGPCVVKKLEASQRYPELSVMVLTYRELNNVFAHFTIRDSTDASRERFDVAEASTRMYPTDGGLTESSGIKDMLPEGAIRIVSGYKNCDAALAEFKTNEEIRFLDILYCPGGCINGPGVASTLTTEQRKQKIHAYASLSSI